ncbi:MAG: XRE family transcriptional regulator [Rhodoblastus sp.]|nr:XRE family transcriptional regulator [Rhodoblastus sp.]
MHTQRPALSITPRLMRRERAASYLDVSPTTFDKLVRDELIPAAKTFHSFKVWDRADLDAFADHLPYSGEQARRDTSWEE